jgi:cell division septal protein FtsQ
MSWLKRKARNRRLGSDHVLDVKVRSEQVRANRLRLGALALALVFATVFSLFLLWQGGEWVLNRLLYENKTYAIRDIDVQTDGVIAPDVLRRWAGVKVGENLLALDLGRVKRDLEMVSTIQSVAVERVLPGTLRLRVSERDPLAQIYMPRATAGGGLEMTILQLDREGYVMTPPDPRQLAVAPADTNDVLPVITGANTGQLAPGRQVGSSQVRSALKLLDAFGRSPMAGIVDLRQVDVSSPVVLVARTSEGSEITFSVQDMDHQLRRWRQIYDVGQRLNKAVATLDLSVSNNIPATWVDANTLPPPVPRSKNQQHTRKRNV